MCCRLHAGATVDSRGDCVRARLSWRLQSAASGSSRLKGAQTTAQNLWPIDSRIVLTSQKTQRLCGQRKTGLSANATNAASATVGGLRALPLSSVSSRAAMLRGQPRVMTPAANFTVRVNASAASVLNPAPKSVRSTKSTASTVVAPGVWLAICWRPRVS